jgi:hypothetical protein
MDVVVRINPAVARSLTGFACQESARTTVMEVPHTLLTRRCMAPDRTFVHVPPATIVRPPVVKTTNDFRLILQQVKNVEWRY